MHWLIDESKLFVFAPKPPMSWKIATVAGAILPYEGRKHWNSIHRLIYKGSEYKSEAEISRVLDVLIECQVKGILMIGDIGYTSSDTAEQFRKGWLDTHYQTVHMQPQQVRESLKQHLDYLMEMSLQDFFKTLTILETIRGFVQWMVSNLPHIRTIDVRKIKLIIDDQAKPTLTSLKHFVHYFLQRCSQDGVFSAPQGSLRLMAKYLRKDGDKTFLDATKLFNNMIVEDNAKQDDKHAELKIADLLSNFSRRVLNGHYGLPTPQKLAKILISVNPLCFDDQRDLQVMLPSSNRDAINLLLSVKPL